MGKSYVLPEETDKKAIMISDKQSAKINHCLQAVKKGKGYASPAYSACKCYKGNIDGEEVWAFKAEGHWLSALNDFNIGFNRENLGKHELFYMDKTVDGNGFYLKCKRDQKYIKICDDGRARRKDKTDGTLFQFAACDDPEIDNSWISHTHKNRDPDKPMKLTFEHTVGCSRQQTDSHTVTAEFGIKLEKKLKSMTTDVTMSIEAKLGHAFQKIVAEGKTMSVKACVEYEIPPGHQRTIKQRIYTASTKWEKMTLFSTELDALAPVSLSNESDDK